MIAKHESLTEKLFGQVRDGRLSRKHEYRSLAIDFSSPNEKHFQFYTRLPLLINSANSLHFRHEYSRVSCTHVPVISAPTFRLIVSWTNQMKTVNSCCSFGTDSHAQSNTRIFHYLISLDIVQCTSNCIGLQTSLRSSSILLGFLRK